MRTFSRGFLDGLEEVDGFILEEYKLSPSCGFADVKVYSGPERVRPLAEPRAFSEGLFWKSLAIGRWKTKAGSKNLIIRERF